MKRKEINNLARKIGEQEMLLLKEPSPEDKARIEKYIEELASKAHSFEDIVALDEAVQDYIAKNS